MARPGPYPEEFKQRAVQLVTEMGMTPIQVARDLGCSGKSVRNWVRQAEIDRGRREGLSSEERQRPRELERDIASTVDRTQTQDVFTALGLGLWHARMTEQLVRTLAVGLKLEPHESLGDAAGQLTRGPWDKAEKALLDRWPEEVQIPEALGDRLAAVRHFRNDRLAHGLCDDLTRVIFDPNAADELLRELNDFISSCQQLQQDLAGHLVGHLAARRGIDTTQAAQAAELFVLGVAANPTDFRDVSLSDADQWAPHLVELISERDPAMAATLRSTANEGQQGKDRPDD